MIFSNSHKAIAITLLIAGTLVLSVISIELRQHNISTVSEILVEITPESIPEILEKELNNTSKKTNRAFNASKKQKHVSHSYKSIAPPEDFIDPRLENIKNNTYKPKKATNNTAKSTINNEELTAFKSLNSILSKRSNAVSKSNPDNTVNKNSSIIYSLIDRTDLHLPVPIYLCEAYGKIVVNITVNGQGQVYKTSINNAASRSKNKCLEQHALDFAQEARFNSSPKTSQTGTITFNFEGR